MKIFDLHADIGYNVMRKRAQKQQHILASDHVQKLQAGEISYICMASYFEGREDWQAMKDMIQALKEEIAECEDVQLVLTKEDLYVPDRIHAILSVEGMCGIRDHPIEKINYLYEQGIKVASFTWNDENALATGARGNAQRGLSDMGVQALKRMQEHKMIIDVSHANEKTFWDILKHSHGGVIATHSNARSLCEHVRNLKDEQLLAIAKQGGLVGVVSAGFFVAKEREQQDVVHLVEHIAYMKNLIGIDHISFGFDFMDDFDNYEDDVLLDMRHASQAQLVIEAMSAYGFDEEEIRKVAYENALNYLKQYL